MRWRPHVSATGEVYSLAHLHPFSFIIQFEAHRGVTARTVRIDVGFALHVFTCGVSDADEPVSIYRDDREVRAFHMGRYVLSHRLRPLIEKLDRRKCYFAGRENYFTVEADGVPSDHEYRIFFDVRRKSADAVDLVIQSAYLARSDELPRRRRAKAVRFRVIVSESLRGKRPREAP